MNWPNMNTNILIKTLSLYLKLRSKHHENSELSLRRLLHNAITHKLEFRKKTHNKRLHSDKGRRRSGLVLELGNVHFC